MSGVRVSPGSLTFFFEIACRAGHYLANVRRTFAGLTSLNIDDVNEGVDETFKGR
ncbi:unannotated protein [freshwater metagenome]|uniref:Unannotated protein n=1 Tax=freshwater metagenome TaxID=449393 RepID=A0A6J7DJ53_9ZZZZ